MTYTLHVVFKSNERPWSTEYDPGCYAPKNDSDAERWAYQMQEGLGSGYQCTLLRDGVAMYDCTKPMANLSAISDCL